MKITTFLALLVFSWVSYGNDSTGKNCLYIPGRGAETVKIATSCKQGDIIVLNKLHIATLCDFNSAIVNYNGPDQYLCVYLGKKREPREGSK
jgi:hypothetical protein